MPRDVSKLPLDSYPLFVCPQCHSERGTYEIVYDTYNMKKWQGKLAVVLTCMGCGHQRKKMLRRRPKE